MQRWKQGVLPRTRDEWYSFYDNVRRFQNKTLEHDLKRDVLYYYIVFMTRFAKQCNASKAMESFGGLAEFFRKYGAVYKFIQSECAGSFRGNTADGSGIHKMPVVSHPLV